LLIFVLRTSRIRIIAMAPQIPVPNVSDLNPYNSQLFGHYPSPLCLFNNNVSETGFCLHPQVKVYRASPHLQTAEQHKTEYINQTQHKSSAGVKTNTTMNPTLSLPRFNNLMLSTRFFNINLYMYLVSLIQAQYIHSILQHLTISLEEDNICSFLHGYTIS
jgi:hypothetical protein